MDTEREEHIQIKQYKLKRKPPEKKDKICTQSDKNAYFPDAAFMFSNRDSHQKCVYL